MRSTRCLVSRSSLRTTVEIPRDVYMYLVVYVQHRVFRLYVCNSTDTAVWYTAYSTRPTAVVVRLSSRSSLQGSETHRLRHVDYATARIRYGTPLTAHIELLLYRIILRSIVYSRGQAS